jgi:FlaA1/EpsC-like NDP-sugar epimerase
MEEFFDEKKILVTGGAGSVGREIVKELLKYNPKVIRIFDSNENLLFYLKDRYREYSNIRCLLGDIRDKDRLSLAMEDIDIVFHTAALKHVEICEYNPFEALCTNVSGTQNVIEAARENDVDKVIFTSSDKAVNPSNTMGATKLLAEKLIISANYYRGPRRRTKYSCVRFGNILGSSGSVIPLIKQQIEEGGPITITDEKMTRFILTQKQALDFLFRSTIIAKGGEIFVPKMSAIKILDLIEVLIDAYASRCGRCREDIKIKHIGKKSGEKMHEELMTEEEASRCIEIEDIYVILPQLKELSHLNARNYKGSKRVLSLKLISRDVTPLSKKEIKRLLIDERLI